MTFEVASRGQVALAQVVSLEEADSLNPSETCSSSWDIRFLTQNVDLLSVCVALGVVAAADLSLLIMTAVTFSCFLWSLK